MSRKAHGQIRRSQLITTFGPGALVDLPKCSAIIGGLEWWGKMSDLEEIIEPRLTRKLEEITGVKAPRFFAPPQESSDPRDGLKGIVAWRFPEWFVVHDSGDGAGRERSRRLVSKKNLDQKGRFENRQVVATRFVRGCPKGHVDDIDWFWFVHGPNSQCRRPLWLDERGTSGDLGDLFIRCECGVKPRSLYEATQIEMNPLETCSGSRPWLGKSSKEGCNLPSRLLIRTASNAYFPQLFCALSLPNRGSVLESAVHDIWDDLQVVQNISELDVFKRKPRIAEKLAPFRNEEVFDALEKTRNGSKDEKPVKLSELDAILNAPEGFGDDVPVDPNFHTRRLPEPSWKHGNKFNGIEAIYQLHRLREVLVLVGFTRFEAVMPDINGEYETDVERAEIAREPTWFPAVENRGEGIFIQLQAEAMQTWIERPEVKERLESLAKGHQLWCDSRKNQRPFPGGQYLLLHTLSHLLIQAVSTRCGYPASSIRERIYADMTDKRFGILLYTGSPDSDGTLGGLVQQARHIENHLAQALRVSSLCSNDPICAQHSPGKSMEGRWLHGAACHGCALIAEPSCEMRNDYLDRALVVPVIGVKNVSFFRDQL